MKTDFCIIGGGIAGLSIAAELSTSASVVVLEREKDLAYHTTGRSAALYSELSADSTALALSKLTRPFLVNPPEGFTEYPLHKDISCIFTATAAEAEQIDSAAKKLDKPSILNADQMLERVPILRTGAEHIMSGILEEDAFRIDVGALVLGYRKQIKQNGGEIRCQAEVAALTQEKNSWKVDLLNNDKLSANRVINAAGAWGDVIAELAGVAAIGLSPRRRNIIVFDGPENMDVDHWPAVGSISGAYYFLPEAGKLMGSSADEVPSIPCDAQPDEYDIALAADNIESATTLEIKHIHHKWGGLRTFSPDRQLVVGYDAEKPGFFWFVGQGGFGIQTSAAAARAGALLAMEEPLSADFITAGVSEEVLSPQRFGHLGASEV
ncbi:MAG: D-arginine dehydrogenase [Planctomycetota bacterium]|jgi:D-arginine dehydrogenase